ncbi:hypothetical protein [Methyloversatilis sp. XJ19-49]|uniref:hypothetical protein n=1 Tax=Methyloversatilis sp. XJ19-49 TaxID=2963429 RepID=UPI00211BEDD5|nr:hypothetical protein [Methyloversatilis sp. XJ19-49]MCQ9378795.1 hypothetical protein [Methyloversatilis sp. XJ19-49]
MSLGFEIVVVEAADIALGFDVVVLEAADISLGFRIVAIEALDIGLSIDITVQSATITSPQKWQPVVTLAGVDVSQRITGEIRIDADEGEARTASFIMRPAPGPLTLPDWTGAAVTIDIAQQDSIGNAVDARRLFTGVVDVPDLDVAEQLVAFECTDQLQQVVRSLPREWIDTNVGGFYSEAVSGEPVDTLQYADARLASVPASLDLDPYQSARVTPWAIDSAAILTLTESSIIDGSLRVELAGRANIRNEVETVLQYRFPRLRARVVSVNFERTINQYTSQGLDIPNRAMIEQALSGMSGWQLRGDINIVPVDPGSYESSGSGGTVYTVISATDAPQLALGFAARFSNRWVQWVTEEYRLNVAAQASIDALGLSRATFDGAVLDAEFDDGAWLFESDAEPALTLPTTGDVSLDYGGDGRTDRAAAQNAAATLVAQARNEILSSHRDTHVSAMTPLHAGIDLNQRIEIDTPRLSALGKVIGLTHRMDIDAGEHDTEFAVAISGFSAVGLQDDDEPDAPAAPTDPTPAPGSAAYGCICDMYVGQVSGAPEFDEALMIGFSTNARAGSEFDAGAPAYPYALSVQAPEIEAAVRDPITLTQAASYAVAIPQDLLEITAL